MADYVAPETSKVTKYTKAGYSIKVIEGTGELKDYYRLCNKVVRNSRLFDSVFKKMVFKAREAGKHRYWKDEFKKRLKENQDEFKSFIAFTNKTVSAYEKKIAKLEKYVVELKKAREHHTNRWREERNKKNASTKKNVQLLKEITILRRNDRFFTAPISMKTLWLDPARAELMVRAAVTFLEYNQMGKIDHNEFLIFATGLHLKAFNKQDILNRYGQKVALQFTRTVNKQMRLGYIQRLHRKDLYYITETGKDFFSEIVSTMMKRRMNTYYGGIFDEFKVTKRNLSS